MDKREKIHPGDPVRYRLTVSDEWRVAWFEQATDDGVTLTDAETGHTVEIEPRIAPLEGHPRGATMTNEPRPQSVDT